MYNLLLNCHLSIDNSTVVKILASSWPAQPVVGAVAYQLTCTSLPSVLCQAKSGAREVDLVLCPVYSLCYGLMILQCNFGGKKNGWTVDSHVPETYIMNNFSI